MDKELRRLIEKRQERAERLANNVKHAGQQSMIFQHTRDEQYKEQALENQAWAKEDLQAIRKLDRKIRNYS